MSNILKIIFQFIRFMIYGLLAPIISMFIAIALNIDNLAPYLYILILGAFISIDIGVSE